ncbi:STAS domain-containing protein [Planctomicrobium sp. SH661]|uniref:STAS domain-containing protein n=1 Tax=Planctomicrobium sp. SH661 TaxID=3448124 RepID=UPI003F5B7D1C
MPHLNATLRNDYLRITIHDGHADAPALNAMQAEFVEHLQSAAFSDVVIVDLPSVDQLGSGLVSMLLTWRRIAALAGRKFRINGVSRIVSQIEAQMSAKMPATRSGPHHLRSPRHVIA